MADEQKFLDQEAPQQEEDVEIGKKVGFLPAIVIKILKWTAIGLIITALVVTVTVLVSTWFLEGRIAQTAGVGVSPPYEELSEELEFYRNIEEARGHTSDVPPQMFLAKIDIGYEKGNRAINTELIDRTPQIHNLIFLTLKDKKANDLSRVRELQQELLNKINRIMRNGKIKAVFIQELQVF